MRKAGEIVGDTLDLLKASVEPGMTTRDLDRIAFKEITRRGATPTFKGYRGFPATICASVNQEIVHGIPSKRIIKEGDIVKVDVGATYEGLIGDAAVTIAVGEVDESLLALMKDTRLGLEAGIKAAVPGGRVGDIGAAIQAYGESRGYGVVREFVGHGVGRFLHEDPQVRTTALKDGAHCCERVCASPLSRCSIWGTGARRFWMTIGRWLPQMVSCPLILSTHW